MCPLFSHTPSGPAGGIFSRLHWRCRYQQGGQVHSSDVHANKSCTSLGTFRAFEAPSLAHTSDQSNTSNGHDKHSFGFCSGEGHHPTQCIERLGYSIVLFLPSPCSASHSFFLHSSPTPLGYNSCSLSVGKDSLARDHCRLVDLTIGSLHISGYSRHFPSMSHT